jgi:hypothetical protein
VPNLLADRAFWVPFELCQLNVRRLMYQSLIWSADLRHESRGLGAAVDAQDLQGAAEPLVDGVRRDVELDRDFLGRHVLVDQTQTIELARAQPRHTGRELRVRVG